MGIRSRAYLFCLTHLCVQSIELIGKEIQKCIGYCIKMYYDIKRDIRQLICSVAIRSSLTDIKNPKKQTTKKKRSSLTREKREV